MGKKNKSKAPTGRAAAKQKAKKSGNGSGGSWTPSSARNGSRPQYGWSDDDDDDNMKPAFRGFAGTNNMKPNALNSPRNFSLHATSVKLRHQAIKFVSAGTNTPDEFLPKQEEREVFVAEDSSDIEEDSEGEEQDIDDSTLQTNIIVESEIKMSEHAFEQMNIQSPGRLDPDKETSQPSGAETPLFVVDTVGDPSLASRSAAKGKARAPRSPSPTPSNSSEEVVVFQGRNNPAPSAKPTPAVKPPPRTKFKDVLTPAINGGYQALTINTSAVRDQTQSEQLAAVQAFRGTSTNATPVPQPKPKPAPQASSAPTYQPKKPQQQPSPPTAIGWGANTSKFEQEVKPDATWAPAPAGSWWKNKSKPRPDLDLSEYEKMAIDEKPRTRSKVMFIEPNEDTEAKSGENESGGGEAEVAIQTLQAEVKSLQQSKRRARQASREQDGMSAKASAATSTPKRRGKRGRKKDNRQLRDPIEDEDDEEDDDAVEAAIADYMSNVADGQLDGAAGDIFATTAHSSAFGPSLVVNGKEIGDDEVLPNHFDMMSNSDTSSEEAGPIGLDTSEISSAEEMDLSNLSSSELEDELEYTEREQWEDEEDLRQRRQERMTDEQIAKLFAKQQELGIEDDELIIDNGEYMSMSEEVDGIGDIARARVGLANISAGRSNKHGMRRRSNRRSGDFTFPDASALADTVEQYGENGFDIMDFDRPSLRPTKKGRKGTLPAELEALSDEDLKENMRTTWANDRNKKSAKKAEREELRMQGLLGTPGRTGKADLSQKYPFGMTTAQIHEELRLFLEDDNQQSRPFPPMAKSDRKELHEIAVVLNLTSKSIGGGKTRFPVLTKTSRTHYTPDLLDRAIAASEKGFLGRGSRTARKLTKPNSKAAKGFGGTAAASLKNGEVVGAGAAELGKENFGHRLMEKMGWSKGMALGKGGEGMLLPVEQKVRLGTAGLG